MQMTVVGYISDTEEIMNVFWSNIQPTGVAAFHLSERSLLPPTLSAKDFPGGWTQVLNMHQIEQMDGYPAESDKDSAPDSISNTKIWLDWISDLDNPKSSDDNLEADNKSDIGHDTDIEVPESLEHQDMSTASNVSRLIRPTRRSMK